MWPLITNQIHDACRGHDKRMPQFSSFQSGRPHSLPAQNNSPIRNRTIGQFIPSDYLTSFTLHIFTHPLHKISLQILFMGQMFFFHPCLTKRAFFPIRLISLITSQMNIPGRKQLHHFINYILQEGKYTVIACTINNIGVRSTQTGQHSYKILHYRTSQLRVRCQRSIAVCRHFYFRNHLDLPFGCISNHLFHVFLRIKSTDRSRFSQLRIPSRMKRYIPTIHAPGPHFRKTRMFFYFQAPAIIIA